MLIPIKFAHVGVDFVIPRARAALCLQALRYWRKCVNDINLAVILDDAIEEMRIAKEVQDLEGGGDRA